METDDFLKRLSAAEAMDAQKVKKRKIINGILDGYVMVYPMARGAFSQVYLAKMIVHKGCRSHHVAIKKFVKRADAHRVYNSEIRALVNLKDSHLIIRLLDYHSFQHTHFIVMELGHTTLRKRIRRLHMEKSKPFVQKRKLMKHFTESVLSGIRYMHQSMFAHRDIKSENILVMTDDTVKICDFGLAVCMKPSERAHSICGTVYYMACELFFKQTASNGYDPFKVDVWAFGVLTFEIFHDALPFDGSVMSEIVAKIKRRKHREFDKKISPKLADHIRACWLFVSQRPSSHLIFRETENTSPKNLAPANQGNILCSVPENDV